MEQALCPISPHLGNCTVDWTRVFNFSKLNLLPSVLHGLGITAGPVWFSMGVFLDKDLPYWSAIKSGESTDTMTFF